MLLKAAADEGTPVAGISSSSVQQSSRFRLSLRSFLRAPEEFRASTCVDAPRACRKGPSVTKERNDRDSRPVRKKFNIVPATLAGLAG